MSQSRGQTKVSFKAGDTLSAYRIVALTAANTVDVPQTNTQSYVGITQDAADSGAAVEVCIMGSSKCIANSSIAAGAPVTAVTATGYATSSSGLNNTTTAAQPRLIGFALEAASTNAIIEVLIDKSNTYKIAYA